MSAFSKSLTAFIENGFTEQDLVTYMDTQIVRKHEVEKEANSIYMRLIFPQVFNLDKLDSLISHVSKYTPLEQHDTQITKHLFGNKYQHLLSELTNQDLVGLLLSLKDKKYDTWTESQLIEQLKLCIKNGQFHKLTMIKLINLIY